MKNFISKFCLFFFIGILFSCNQKEPDIHSGLLCLDLEKNVGFKNKNNLKPRDLKIILLDESNPDSFFKNAKILDVTGDTIFLLENDFIPTRILMFSLTDGNYLGQVNHYGEGPGDYRFIIAAFINSLQQSVIIPDIDRPYVYEYSLKNDSLINTFNRPDILLRLPPTGNVMAGINIGELEEDRLKILQFDSTFEETDSLLLHDFEMIPFTTIWSQSGADGIVFNNDTLSMVRSGHLSPIVTLNFGKYKLKLSEARKMMEEMMYSTESDADFLKRLDNYIIVRNFQFSEDNILVNSIHRGKNFSDLYDIHTGEILNRFESEKDFNGPGKIILEKSDGHTFIVERLFTKDNIWYGMTDESESSRLMNKEPGDSQVMIICFKI